MDQTPRQEYDISTEDVLFPVGEWFDVKSIADAEAPWWNRTLSEVSGSWVRLGVMEGDFHWHKHDDTDDFFLVLRGVLDIQLRDRTVTLGPGQMYIVPKGVEHRPVAKEEVHLLLIEPTGTPNTGDVKTAAPRMTA